MRVDRRRHVRDLALAAPLFGARGLNSAAYAQGLNALADVKNPKFVLDPSSPEPLPTRWAAAFSCRPSLVRIEINHHSKQ